MTSSAELSKVDVEKQWEEYADSFEEPKTKETWATDGDWRLVGNGKQSHDWCGQHAGYLGCLNEDEHKQPTIDGLVFEGALIRHKHKSCHSYNCPVCYLSWAVQQAHEITDKLEELGPKYGVADHIVLSLPEGYLKSTNGDFNKLTKKVFKALINRAVVGGCSIFHAFRYNDMIEAAEKMQMHGWYWSPHFHILGFIPNKAEFYARIPKMFLKDGFVVKLKEKRKSVFATAWYQLNHASIMYKVEHFEVARWFGDTISKETKKLRENSKKIKQLSQGMSKGAVDMIRDLMMAGEKSVISNEDMKLIVALEKENKEIKACQKLKKEGNEKKHRQKCPICGKEMVKLEYFGLRTDLKQLLQQCRKERLPNLTYYKNSKVMFFDSVIDGKNQVLNWAEK